MKIFEAKNVREADEYTIKNEPITSVDLMERAASCISDWITQRYTSSTNIAIILGFGNNGGDGLVVARQLIQKGYNVDCYDVNVSSNYSPDFKINRERLEALNIPIHKIEEVPSFDGYDLILDAIFGSGLNRSVEGKLAQIIASVNRSNAIRIAVDIPSGLFAEDNTLNRGAIVKANYTLSFQFPKLSFLFPENEKFVGHFEVLDIGIHPDYIRQTPTPYHYTLSDNIDFGLLRRDTFAHKGTFGHTLLFTGSQGKMGASILSAKACIKSGCGLVSVLVPQKYEFMIPLSMPEIMTETYENKDISLEKFSAVGVGCGIGTSEQAKNILSHLLKEYRRPMVLDADAINLLASDETLLKHLPKKSILTPHLKELERLIGVCDNHFERLQKTAELAQKHHIYILVKGAYSTIVTPDKSFYFNTTGNPGMATAGSGDVLTGVISSLLSQNIDVLEALKMAVFIHGYAGDIAKKEYGETSLTSSDIINKLPLAFKESIL